MSIGFTEIIVILVVALLVLGPEKAPIYAKKFGKALGQLRGYSSEIAKDIRENVVDPVEETVAPVKEAVQPLTSLKKDVQNSVQEITKPLSDSIKTPTKSNSQDCVPTDTTENKGE